MANSGPDPRPDRGLAGPHYHWFTEATETLAIAAGDTLITYVLLDPCDPPREVMLQFRNGTSWEHRAYWGENLFLAGVDGTDSRRPMGPLPPVGEWIRLEVPANLVGLEGETIHGISFTLVDGHAWFDRVGKAPGSTGSGDGEAIPEASGKRPPAPGDLDSSQGKNAPISLAGDGKVWFDLTGKIAATGGAAVGVVATGSHKTAHERIETEPAAGDESLTIQEETSQEGVQTDSPKHERVPISLLVDADFLEPVTGHGSGDAQRVSIYSPELQLLTESEFTTTTPAPAWDYVYFAGQPVAQIEVATGATRWTFNDHLGTPVIQTDAAGAVVWRLEQEPYGNDLAFRAGSSLHQPLRFPGQERRVESELAYNVFRWYRGGWGRYSQADPIGLIAGLNQYRYVLDNPVLLADPRGLVQVKQQIGSGWKTLDKAAYSMAYGDWSTDFTCSGTCQGGFKLTLSLDYIHNFFYSTSSNYKIETHHAEIAWPFIVKAAQRWKNYEVKYESLAQCNALGASYAQDLEANLLKNWPDALAKTYFQAQQDYEDTHHGFPCGWIPGLCAY